MGSTYRTNSEGNRERKVSPLLSFMSTEILLAEIGTLERVWTSIKIRICYWYCLRAIKAILNFMDKVQISDCEMDEEIKSQLLHGFDSTFGSRTDHNFTETFLLKVKKKQRPLA